MGLIPIIAGALGALATSKASSNAAKAQTDATAQQVQMARDFRTEDIARFAPYTSAGVNALGTYAGQLGSSYETSPYANYLLTQGRDQIESGAAGRGGLFSGSTLGALDDHRTGVIAQDRDNWMSRLYGLAQGGQAAAGFQANSSANYGGQINQAYGDRGNAISANYINQGNQINGLIGNGLSAYAYMKGPQYAA